MNSRTREHFLRPIGQAPPLCKFRQESVFRLSNLSEGLSQSWLAQ